MRHLNLLFLLLFSVTFVQAQRDKTLFNGNHRTGAFGAPIFEFYEFGSGGKFETASGGGGALIVGDFFIGGYGIGDINLIENIDNDRLDISMGHGGLWFGATPLQQHVVHPYMSLRMGWGAAEIEIDNNNFSYDDNFFVLSPEVGMEINVFRWFRISGTVGYQWFSGLEDADGVGEIDINNLRAGLTLRFGGFGRDRKNDW